MCTMVFLYPVTFPAELAGARSPLRADRSRRSSPIGRAGNRFPRAGPRRRLLAVTGRGHVVLKGSPGGSPAQFGCISMQSLRGSNVLSCRWSRTDAQVVPRHQLGPFVQDVPLGVVRPSVHLDTCLSRWSQTVRTVLHSELVKLCTSGASRHLLMGAGDRSCVMSFELGYTRARSAKSLLPGLGHRHGPWPPCAVPPGG